MLTEKYSLASAVLDMYALSKDLPGRISCSHDFNVEHDEHVVLITGHDPATQEESYECKLGFDFNSRKESRIKNFLIFDPKHRGQGLGTQIVANLLEVTRRHPGLEQIGLTAELERGALVWLKMGWLPEKSSFTRLQKKCLPKLDTLQQLLSPEDRLPATTYGIFRDILDPKQTSEPAYAWALADSGASYRLQALKDLQSVAAIGDRNARHAAIGERARRNGLDLSAGDVDKADKNLIFLRNLDLDNLAREGKIKVAATILAWESWKGSLRMDNQQQVQRLEAALERAHPGTLSSDRSVDTSSRPDFFAGHHV